MDLIERIGIIAEIARRKRGRPGRLGKTAMMKLLFLLQEVYGVDLGYRFSLYTYGPYVSDVMSDIDFAEVKGAVTISYNEERGYEIAASSQAADAAVASCEQALDLLLQTFGDMSARDLELRSTAVYLSKDCPRSNLLMVVQKIKPKFSKAEVELALDDLARRGIIDEK